MANPLFKNVCDEQVFAKLFQNISKDLHDFIFHKFGSRFNPEDKVQEAFIKLWKNCKDVPPDKAKSYVFTIANNLSLNDAKHLKVVRNYQNAPVQKSTSITPEHILLENEYRAKFDKALNKLSEGQRTAFLLNRVEGKKHKEIAEMLGISQKAVEKRIYTALNKLREDIQEI